MELALFLLAATCSVRREISPCTCEPPRLFNTIEVKCENVGSFNQVVDALQNRFAPEVNINLRINMSHLDDLETRTFADMNLRLKNLRMNFNQLKTLPESSFRNLTFLEYLSLSDNELEEVPRHVLKHTPRLGTLDLGLQLIKHVSVGDFNMNKVLRHLVLVHNELTRIDQGAIPNTMRSLHLGHNHLVSLNGTLRDLDQLELLFINNNKLTTLENELPKGATRLNTILANYNQLHFIPQEIKMYQELIGAYFISNFLRSLDGVFRHSSWLEVLKVNENQIEELATDEFEKCSNLTILYLEFNHIRSINGSMLPLKKIKAANFSHNALSEFSLNEIRGLHSLGILDLSHNRIERLSGKMENIVEPDLFVVELRLNHNRLKTLDGAMMGLNTLVKLDVSHNQLNYISPDDLIGLEELTILDVSYNRLQTLEETSKSFLPKLIDLNASFNNLTKLDKDFHGLPVLCTVDLSHNQISSISPILVEKTRCITHSTGVVSTLNIRIDDNPILCNDDVDRIINEMKLQEANLTGLGHCIVPTAFVPDPSAVIQQLPVDDPFDETSADNSNVPDDAIKEVMVQTPIIESHESLEVVDSPVHNAINGMAENTTVLYNVTAPTLVTENTQDEKIDDAPSTTLETSTTTTTMIPTPVAELPHSPSTTITNSIDDSLVGVTEPIPISMLVSIVTAQPVVIQSVKRESNDLENNSQFEPQTTTTSTTDSAVPADAALNTAIPYIDVIYSENQPSVSYAQESAPDWVDHPLLNIEPPPPEAIIPDDIKLI